ncbi:MAG: RNA polymerase sigma factor [Thermomicrobiales bacterium]
MSEQNDNLLIQEVAKGNPDALAALYDRHGRLAYSVAYRVLSDGPAAEEAVQDAFLTLWRKAGSFDASRGVGLRPWLLTIVRNASIDSIRRRNRYGSREVELDADAPFRGTDDPVAEVLLSLDRTIIRQAMTQLPDEQRSAIEMAFFEGMTHREIAERSGLPLGTVKGRLRLGLHKLQESLTEHYVASRETG